MNYKKVAISQSNYIPWRGYFNLIDMADLFIFHDDIQYTKNDWRNRNKIKTAHSTKWLTIPCGVNTNRLICEVELLDHSWQIKHWRRISENYHKAFYFHKYESFFEDFYLNHLWKRLSDMNQYLIKYIAREFLDITTQFEDSRKYNLRHRKGDRVLELLKKTGATEYISGPAAKNYLNPEELEKNNIKLTWMDYSGYREYNQLFSPPFINEVSIVDLIFNTGPNARNFLQGI